jgi:hypothetical protein
MPTVAPITADSCHVGMNTARRVAGEQRPGAARGSVLPAEPGPHAAKQRKPIHTASTSISSIMPTMNQNNEEQQLTLQQL